MVVVPYFLVKLLYVQARTSHWQKKLHDPNSTISSVRNTPPTLPPNAAGTAASATSNLFGGPNGAHHLIVIVLLVHIVIIATCSNGHINSNKHIFSRFVLSVLMRGESIIVVGLPDWGREAHVTEIRRKELWAYFKVQKWSEVSSSGDSESCVSRRTLRESHITEAHIRSWHFASSEISPRPY